MAGSSNWVHLEDVSVLKETEKAFLIVVEGQEYWLPKSQTVDPDDYNEGDKDVTISVTDWWAEQNGLE